MKNLSKLSDQISQFLDLPPSLEPSNLGQLNVDNLLLETGFKQYKALLRVTYNPQTDQHIGAEKIAEMLRAVPGGTRVSTIQSDKKHNRIIYSVRVISQKPAIQCFITFKQTCLNRYKGIISGVEIGAGSIEEKAFVR